ncbi:MAG TPA: MlaD family protein [Planctomycetota bacterium]|jgi:phospholipid/cholesterol/gamma-HCH transport system substrate-binding protein|nr:MlaD family protein [Planctomycetota bacterium]
MNKNRTVLLGLFFLAALGVLGYYTFALTDFNLFKKPSTLTVHFSQTNGLREGDSVLVAGMRWGKVKKLVYDPGEPDPKKRIQVLAILDQDIILRRGFTIRIEDATLLGGKNLSIEPGPAEGEYVDTRKEMLLGEVGKNPLASLGDLVAESQRGVTRIIEDLSTLTSGVREGKGPFGHLFTDEKMAQDLADTLHGAALALANLERVTADLAAGKGTAGELLANRELYDQLLTTSKKLNDTLDQTAGLVSDFRNGKGALPRLFTDERMANDLAGSVAGLNSIMKKISDGQGTIGMLVNDDSIARNVASITGKIDRGEGAGALLTKTEVYDNLVEFTENLAVVSTAVRNGQGSIGRLVMDDDIYQQVKTALLIVQRAVEEYREAAPVTTFTSVFFGAF